MVYYLDPALDRTFAALSDRSRRAMLRQLAENGVQSAGDLARPFALTLPAVLKHIDVLARAGLVRREKIGRTVRCTLAPEPMREAMDWLERYEKFWSDRLERLADLVKEEDDP